MNIEFYSSLKKDNSMSIGLNILLLFVCVFYYFIKKIIKNNKELKNEILLQKKYKSIIIFFIIVILLLYIWNIGYISPMLGEERGIIKPIYEYSIILFILLSFYSGGNKKLIHIVNFLFLIYIIKDLKYGGRIASIQLIICYFLIFLSWKIEIK